MKKFINFIFLFIIPFMGFSEEESLVYLYKIDGNIDPAATMRTTKAIEKATEINADLILLKLNTFGGTLEDADKIRTMILQCEIPFWVFIDNNAASAGALISIACDSIYMHSGSSIGAATVVDQNGTVQPDKYQSYMRSLMRTTAEATGRRPDIAEAMVDPTIYIKGIIDSTKVLTFTTSEAIKYNYCQGQAESVKEVLALGGIENYEIKEQRFSAIEKFIGFLINPLVSGLLLMVIIMGVYFEFQTPGVGFPLIAAIIAAALYFAPLYLEGLANNWEILLFVIGLGLIALEIFVIPGFGVAGISGIVLVVTGLIFSLVENVGFDFSGVDVTDMTTSVVTVVVPLIIAIPLCLWLSKRILEKNTFGHLALDTVQESSQGYTVADNDYKNIVGKTGIAITVLRPSGKVEIDGEIYDAVSYAQFIEKGERVEAVRYENTNIIVRKIN